VPARGWQDTDLDEVGLTARHASMFEMLGASRSATTSRTAPSIRLEFVTKKLGFEPDRL
jgi:alanyl-tRNA synthetase